MNKSHIKDAIDNEFKRIKIQNHRNYAEWYGSLSIYAQLVVESILEEDISVEVLSFAQDSPDEEWDDYPFLRVLAEVDSIPSDSEMLGLTNITLGCILADLMEF